MKVLIVTPEFPPDQGGGIISYYRDLTSGLISLGCEVSVLRGSAYINGDMPFKFSGVSVSTLETKRFESWMQSFEHLELFPDLRRHLAASFALHEQAVAGTGYDVVEVTDWGMLFIPWMMNSKAPVLVQLHGSCGQIALREPVAGREAEGTMALLLERSGLPLAPIVSTHSHSNLQWWKEMLGREIDYLPPPLRCDFGNEPFISRSDWITIGRIQHWKGPQVACAAWRQLGSDAPVLNWYGRDTVHGESALGTKQWLASAYPDIWGKTIRPSSQLAPSEVVDLLSKTKVVLIPSEWDVFNLVTVEAMAAGCVVLVSTGAGAADLIEHGKNGFTFPAGDDAALADLVRHIVGLTLIDLESIGRAAAVTVQERLDILKIAQEKMALYKSAGTKPFCKAPPWFSQTLLQKKIQGHSFLNQISIRQLSKHLLHRLIDRIFNR